MMGGAAGNMGMGADLSSGFGQMGANHMGMGMGMGADLNAGYGT